MGAKKVPGRGRPTVDTAPLRVRVPTSYLKAIDRHARSEPDEPTRTEAARRILRDWLTDHGYLQASQKALRPDQLTSHNDG